jgi:hypothetical protein
VLFEASNFRRLGRVDRQEAAMIVMGMEQGELLMAVNAIQGVVDIEDDGTSRKLSQ